LENYRGRSDTYEPKIGRLEDPHTEMGRVFQGSEGEENGRTIKKFQKKDSQFGRKNGGQEPFSITRNKNANKRRRGG